MMGKLNPKMFLKTIIIKMLLGSVQGKDYWIRPTEGFGRMAKDLIDYAYDISLNECISLCDNNVQCTTLEYFALTRTSTTILCRLSSSNS